MLAIVSSAALSSAHARAPDTETRPPPSVAIHLSGNRSFYWSHRKLRYLVVTHDPGVGDSLHGTLPNEQTSVHFGHLTGDAQTPLPAAFLAGGGMTASESRAPAIIRREDCLLCHAISGNALIPSFTAIAHSAGATEAARSRLARLIAKGDPTSIDGIQMPPHPSLEETEIRSVVDFILTLRGADANPRLLPTTGDVSFDDPQSPAALRISTARSAAAIYVLTAAYRRRGTAPDAPPTASAEVRLRSPLFRADEASGSNNTAIASIANVGRVRVAKEAGAYLYFDNIDLTAVSIIVVTLARELQGSAPSGGRIVVRADGAGGQTLGTAEISAARAVGATWDLPIPIEQLEGFHRLYLVLEESPAQNSHAAFVAIEVLPSDHDE